MHGSDLDDVGQVGPGSVGDGVTGRRFNRKKNWLEFRLEKRIEILF